MTKVFQFTTMAIPAVGISAIMGCAVLCFQYRSIFSQHLTSSGDIASIVLSSDNLDAIVELNADITDASKESLNKTLTITSIVVPPESLIIDAPKLTEITNEVKTTISTKLKSFINDDNLDVDKLKEEIEEILKNHTSTDSIQQDIQQKIETVKEIHNLKKQVKEFVAQATVLEATKTENTNKVVSLKSQHGANISVERINSWQNTVSANDKKINDYTKDNVAQKLTEAATKITQIDQQVSSKQQEQKNTEAEIAHKHTEMKQMEAKMKTSVGNSDTVLQGIFDIVEKQRTLSDSEKYKTTVLNYNLTQQSAIRLTADAEVEKAFKEYSALVKQWREKHNQRVDLSLQINKLQEEKQDHLVAKIKLTDQTEKYNDALSTKPRIDGILKTAKDASAQLTTLQTEITDIGSKLSNQAEKQKQLEKEIEQKTAIFNNGLIV